MLHRSAMHSTLGNEMCVEAQRVEGAAHLTAFQRASVEDVSRFGTPWGLQSLFMPASSRGPALSRSRLRMASAMSAGSVS